MIDRDFLRRGGLSETLAQAEREGLLRLIPPAERVASREQMLARAPTTDADVWVFAYGSLMWNPAFHFVETRPAIIHGHHRRFCLLTRAGRGTPQRPGLMLGLDRGGACRGTVMRIEADKVAEELDIIWSREMVAQAYRPIWVRARTPAGTVPAIAFAIDPALPSYAGRLPLDTVAERIAQAHGPMGACTDYLRETVNHLRVLGIRDRGMEAILRRVLSLSAG